MKRKIKPAIQLYLTMTGILLSGFSFSQGEPWTFDKLNIQALPQNDLAEVIYETMDGAIWLGFSYEGLYRYNGYNAIKLDPEDYGLELNNFNRIISIYQLKDGSTILGSRDNGVSLLNIQEKKASSIKNTEDEDVDNALKRVWSFHEDDEGIIWMASWGGLIRYDPKLNSFDLFRHAFNTPRNDKMNPSLFRSVHPDADDPGLLWVTGITGLFSLQKERQVFTHIRHPESLYRDGHQNFDKEHQQYLLTDLEVAGDNLYMSSWGGGILKYNKKNKQWKNQLFTKYTTPKTLDENICNQVSRQGNNLFFTAATGSGVVDISTDEIEYFSDQASVPFSSGYALLKARNGKLWLSTYGDGIWTGSPGPEYVNKIDSLSFEIYLIRLGDDVVWEVGQGTIPKTIIIPPDNDSLHLEFGLINPINPDEVEYQYKIEGSTTDWVSNGRQNYILMSTLPKGKHQLQIRAREGQGIWSFSDPLTIKREIKLYKEPLFGLGISLLIIGMIVIWIRRRVKKAIEQGKTERMLAELKMQAMQAQMNPHFIFNALNSINTYILKQEPEKASDYLDMFSKLIRKILNNSGKPLISLNTDINIIRSYIDIEKIRFGEKFDYSIHIDDNIDQALCLVPPMIIQPYVENAIWHGIMPLEEKGLLWVNYSKQENYLVIEIIDNGIGRKKSSGKRSAFKNDKPMGMDLAGNRVEVFQKMIGEQAEIFITDKNPEIENTGTIIRVTIPYIIEKSINLNND